MERRTIEIRGTVQGVGFRPFVYGLASELSLGGFVRNDSRGVTIEVEGRTESLERFLSLLVSRPPPLARIDALTWKSHIPVGFDRFRIEASDTKSSGPVNISPDVAVCDACLAEMNDPKDRRYRYPFINCTHCGPRLTIIQGAPYDRARTTMARFAMCAPCRAEYADPTNRRFHAQPIACADCGPSLSLLDGDGQKSVCGDPIAAVAEALREGKIAAMKGLGGYHLACDAGNAVAVAELRRRKHRDEKPFAVMVGNVKVAGEFCEMDEGEVGLLTSPGRPIVLLKKRCEECEGILGIAPGNPFLGVMLPYTPLHYLLMGELGGQPVVMTSGNRSDEPICIDEADAIDRLAGIADIFLVHDRAIHVRCDDSVTRMMGGIESPVRRSRGYAPRSVGLPMECPAAILAVGGQMKGTFALAAERRAIISQHLGDLDDLKAYEAFERDVALYEQLFGIQPVVIAHDLHPDYASTRYAFRRAGRESAKGVKGGGETIRLIGVQHHHAHMASCMAENNLSRSVIGVCLDGTGFGTDGAIWGGEFLVGDYRSFKRVAHLRYVPMPGGERAVREPWRMAISHLLDAGAGCGSLEKRLDALAVGTVRQMIERKFNAPLTSSAGRLFDAVAALVGVRDVASYEGQAAMQLEWLASSACDDGLFPFEVEDGIVDTRPLIAMIAAEIDLGADPARLARRFHLTMAEIIHAVCTLTRQSLGIDSVVLSGGVFMNALLTRQATERLERDGFTVYRHQKVPPNDGGLCLGQAAVVAAQLETPAN